MINEFSMGHSRWFAFGIFSIVIVSIFLRFWGLGRFNTLVFDEVYYAKFGNEFLTGTPYYNAHPPLSQYLIAFSIWVGQKLPISLTEVNGLTGSMLAPWMYRWLNAAVGSLMPLIVAATAYLLTRRRSYALISALLIAADGLFLVESRYALNNIYLVTFGLLGQLFVLFSLSFCGTGIKRWLWLGLAGISFGACMAIKWNGLGFLLGIYVFWLMAKIWCRRQSSTLSTKPNLTPKKFPQFAQINFWQFAITLGVIPVLIYSLLWIPHLQLNPNPNFWEMQQQILTYHEGIEDDAHPYCAKWYTWPLMIRPIAYFYEQAGTSLEINPVLPDPPPGLDPVVYDVHAVGNPGLWWFSTLAIFLMAWLFAERAQLLQKVESLYVISPQDQLLTKPHRSLLSRWQSGWCILYLLVNWGANFFPWIKVSRCTFLYHYMGSLVFATLALAWWVDRWLHSSKRYHRGLAITVIFTVLIAFCFWMPIYLGLPISPKGWQMRMWLPSWI